MALTDFCGSWDLAEYAHINDELKLFDGQILAIDVQSWLLGSSSSKPNANPCSGLRLVINGTRFSETATAFTELMFDIEGVQVNDYQSLCGRVHSIENIGFLVPDGVPDYALPSITTAIAKRYEDGDTIVCDTLRRYDNNILRQLSVVTDELYTDRMILVYRLVTDR